MVDGGGGCGEWWMWCVVDGGGWMGVVDERQVVEEARVSKAAWGVMRAASRAGGRWCAGRAKGRGGGGGGGTHLPVAHSCGFDLRGTPHDGFIYII